MGIRTKGALQCMVGKEDALNDGAATPKGHVIPIVSDDVKAKQADTVDSEELTGNRNPAVGFPGDWDLSGQNIVQAVTVDSFCVLCGMLFGVVTPSGTGPYVYAFKPGSAMPMTIWHELGYITASKFDVDFGCALAGLQLQASRQAGNLKATWPVVGTAKHLFDEATTYDATAATYSDRRLNMASCVVSVDGSPSSLITEINCDTKLSATALKTLNGKDYAEAMGDGDFSNSVSITGWWDTASTLRANADAALHSVSVKCFRPGSATHYIEIKYPEGLFVVTNHSGESGGSRQLTLSAKPGILTSSDSIQVNVACDISDLASIL